MNLFRRIKGVGSGQDHDANVEPPEQPADLGAVGFNPQPEPPGQPADLEAVGFNPQPEPPGQPDPELATEIGSEPALNAYLRLEGETQGDDSVAHLDRGKPDLQQARFQNTDEPPDSLAGGGAHEGDSAAHYDMGSPYLAKAAFDNTAVDGDEPSDSLAAAPEDDGDPLDVPAASFGADAGPEDGGVSREPMKFQKRYDSADEPADSLAGEPEGAVPFVATGSNFADSLTAGPLAAGPLAAAREDDTLVATSFGADTGPDAAKLEVPNLKLSTSMADVEPEPPGQPADLAAAVDPEPAANFYLKLEVSEDGDGPADSLAGESAGEGQSADPYDMGSPYLKQACFDNTDDGAAGPDSLAGATVFPRDDQFANSLVVGSAPAAPDIDTLTAGDADPPADPPTLGDVVVVKETDDAHPTGGPDALASAAPAEPGMILPQTLELIDPSPAGTDEEPSILADLSPGNQQTTAADERSATDSIFELDDFDEFEEPEF